MPFPKKLSITLAGSAVILFAGYALISHHYQDAFLPNTEIAGVDVSGRSVTDANQVLLKKVNTQRYTLKDNQTKVLSFSGREAGFSHNFKPLLQKIRASQNGWTWLSRSIDKHQTTEHEDALILNPKLFDQFAKQTVSKLNQSRVAPKNASIDLNSNQFKIIKEVAGNTINLADFKKTVAHGINHAQTTINIKADYDQPTVKSTNKALKTAANKLANIAAEKINYSVNGNTFTVPQTEIHSWLTYQNGTVGIDTTAITKYVYQLKAKYDTFDKALSFKSTKEGTVSVPAGIYGWSISPADEITALTTEVPKGKDFTRTAVIRGSGIDQKSRSIGTTYIEIDKKAQHMWLYQNGKVTLDTDIVTARPPQTTPSGVWSVWKKERNATLKGKNFDGVSEYASPVNYWMPIDETGVGIHDSPWQPKYGGDWYKTHGSHGCINTPPGTMAKLYNAVSEGIPVVVF